MTLSRFGCALTLLVVGCGGGGGPQLPVVPASGTATFGGEPLVGATIVLSPLQGNVVSTATSDESGKFEVITGEQIGALPGKYQVLVSKFDYVAAPGGDNEHQDSQMVGKLVTPEKYAAKETTDLHLEIPAEGSTALEIAVPSATPTTK
jgi:hypothetical protein